MNDARRQPDHFDIAIIGGGLAGLMAAHRAAQTGARTVLFDEGVPNTAGGLGGFAPFSGAKFSLHPAGTGLAPLVGGEANLIDLYRGTCIEFAALGLRQFKLDDNAIAGEESADCGMAFRRYHSVVLDPRQVDTLLFALVDRLSGVVIHRTRVTRLDIDGFEKVRLSTAADTVVVARKVLVATGRLGAALLQRTGIPESQGKGVDVGVRLEFSTRGPLSRLRSMGPDAKYMSDGVRTFCLNSPGRVFHYPGLGFHLPGGVVADPAWPQANVGILCRLPDRAGTLARLSEAAEHAPEGPLSLAAGGANLGWNRESRAVLGADVIDRLTRFVSLLSEAGLISLPQSYDVHYPLLDWHWPVFSQPGRLATSVPFVLAAGDASGHARGLMQAAVMGVLAVKEALG